jgi:hypothetical protein
MNLPGSTPTSHGSFQKREKKLFHMDGQGRKNLCDRKSAKCVDG